MISLALLACLSTPINHFNHYLIRHGWKNSQHYDIVLSKDPEIAHSICLAKELPPKPLTVKTESVDLAPSNFYYIDSNPENEDAARKLGMQIWGE
jgi:hypothetical protein